MLSPKYIFIFVSFLDMLSAGMLMPQLPYHIKTLGASHIEIGRMGALYATFQLISGPLIGTLSDLRGRKSMLLLCLSICGLSYLTLGLVSSVSIFLTTRLILGLTDHTKLLSKAMEPDYVKDKGDQSVLNRRMQSVSGYGMALGLILGGHIMEAFPEQGFTIITTITATNYTIHLSLIRRLPELKEINKNDGKKENTPVALKLIDSIRTPVNESIDDFFNIDWTMYGDVFLFKILFTLCMMVYYINFGLFLRMVHKVPAKNLGYILSFRVVTGRLCSYFIGYINKLYKNDTDFTLRNSHVFSTLTITLIILALVPSLFVIVALLIPLAIVTSIGGMISLNLITRRSKSEDREIVIKALNRVNSFSEVLTPLIAGIINQYLGPMYVFLIAAVFTGIGAFISNNLRLKSLTDKVK